MHSLSATSSAVAIPAHSLAVNDPQPSQAHRIQPTLSNRCAHSLHCYSQWRSHFDGVCERRLVCVHVVLIHSDRMCVCMVFPNNAFGSRLSYTATCRNRTVELCFWSNIDVVAPLVWIYNIFQGKRNLQSKLQLQENEKKKRIDKKRRRKIL